MVILSLQELFDMVVMSLVVGWLFQDFFTPRRSDPDAFLKNVTPGFRLENLSDFWYALLLVAPSILFHEFGHKFTAMAFGLSATFHAAYTWLFIAVLLKMFAGFLFFVPAYVSYPAVATPFQSALIAFAGPAVNGLFWLGSRFILQRKLGREATRFFILFRRINGFLFVLNMLPIPGFDGFHFFVGLVSALF